MTPQNSRKVKGGAGSRQGDRKRICLKQLHFSIIGFNCSQSPLQRLHWLSGRAGQGWNLPSLAQVKVVTAASISVKGALVEGCREARMRKRKQAILRQSYECHRQQQQQRHAQPADSAIIKRIKLCATTIKRTTATATTTTTTKPNKTTKQAKVKLCETCSLNGRGQRPRWTKKP